MKKLLSLILIFCMSLFVTLNITTSIALAHEHRDISNYEVIVGWLTEPAFEGQKNGVDLRVTNATTQQPVEGLENTVQVEITHVPTGVAKVFNLRTIYRDPGHYTVDLLLTAPGHYRMRFFGTIEGMNVNETFDSKSGGGGYNDVQSSADIQFPNRIAEMREIEGVVKNFAEENHNASEKASRASTVAVSGIVLGAVGLVAGTISLVVSRRNTKWTK
jgi:hypothetical protein